jgi:hypothetical protein
MFGTRTGALRAAGFVLLVTATVARSASAQEPTAADLKKSGNEKMVDSDFVGALEDYQKALALAPDDLGLLYNIGRASGLVGRHPEALQALETFDNRAPPQLKAKIAKFAELVAETRQHVGYLTVNCAVPQARVQLGAQVIGNAPLARVAVEAGAADLRIDAEGYLDDRRPVTVEGTKELSLDCRLLPKSTSGTLVVVASPNGAAISIDGRRVGDTHIELPMAAGPHTIGAMREGYESSTMPVVVAAGSVKTLEIPLRPKTVPLTARWWFWGGIGAVVAGGVVLSVALLTERSADKGTIAPQQLSAPLRF